MERTIDHVWICWFYRAARRGVKRSCTKWRDRIIHRGPDMEGYHLSGDTPATAVALGFRRLSIIDLAAGRQPMYNEDGTVVCVFNGEIYNFMDLRTELQAKGHIFKTHCDTEVILHGYEEYGNKLAAMLRGMFAFVVYDTKTNVMYGARDIFGVKPFYYTQTDAGELLFGSEIKSLLEHPGFRREVNPEALRPYLTFQYSAMNETFFKGTYKMPPAHWFEYKDGKMHMERYWDVDFPPQDQHELRGLRQPDRRPGAGVGGGSRISDVKVGSFLSGGVDSSYITACLMPDDTFSVGFETPDGGHKFDETTEAAELSQKLGIHNYREMLTKEPMPGRLRGHPVPHGRAPVQPVLGAALLPVPAGPPPCDGGAVRRGRRRDLRRLRVYADTHLMQEYKHLPLPLRHLASDVSQHLPYFKGHDFIIKGSGRPTLDRVLQALVFTEQEAYDILKPKYRVGPAAREVAAPIYDRVKDLPELEKKQYLDLNLWLPGDILLKADKMSMAHSLELRVPYLDREVLREAATYPVNYKIAGDTKAVLRAAANKTLPDAWANRTKKGFPVPIAKWLEDPAFSAKVRAKFESDVAAEYFDQDKLVAMLADPRHDRRKIWTAYTFLTWHEQFFEKWA